MRRHIFGWAVVALCVVAGCAPKAQAPKRELSERQRDSLIGVSKLPGGTVVTRALATSDSMAAGAERMNAQVARTGDGSQGEESK